MMHSKGILPKKTVVGGGFTILEVLVASAIMGIVLFVLVSTANTSLQLWRNTSEKIGVEREGRSGISLVAWDLENIVMPPWPLPKVTNNTNLSSFTAEQLSLFSAYTNLLPRVQTNNDGTNSLRLAFLTSKPTDYQQNNDFGDVCYVEYRFISNALWRAFRGSRETFSSLTASPPRFPMIPQNDPSWEIVATNLYQFKVWGHAPNSMPIPYDANGLQTTFWLPTNGIFTNLSLAGIEYQMEVVDQKYMKMFKSDSRMAEALRFKSRKYFQAIQPVPQP